MDVTRAEAVQSATGQDGKRPFHREADEKDGDGRGSGSGQPGQPHDGPAIEIDGVLLEEGIPESVQHAFEALHYEVDLLKHRLETLIAEKDQVATQVGRHAFLDVWDRDGFLHEMTTLIRRMEQTDAHASLILLVLENADVIRLSEGRNALDDALSAMVDGIKADWVEALSIGAIGGEDFALVVVEGGLDGARRKAAALCQSLMRYRTLGGQSLSLRLGVVDLVAGQTPVLALERADRDLRRGLDLTGGQRERA